MTLSKHTEFLTFDFCSGFSNYQYGSPCKISQCYHGDTGYLKAGILFLILIIVSVQIVEDFLCCLQVIQINSIDKLFYYFVAVCTNIDREYRTAREVTIVSKFISIAMRPIA